MLRSTVYLALILFASEIFAASASQPRPYHSRDDLSSPRTINTTILSANGTDLTSFFRTMIYFSSNKTNLTDLSDRQVSFSRPITCRSPNARLLTSYCKYRGGRFGLVPLQEYIIHCQEPPQPSHGDYTFIWPSIPRIESEEGACAPYEICVDGVRGDYRAYCVSHEFFTRLIQRGEKQSGIDIDELEGKTARMIISQADESTPLEVQSIDLQAGLIGNVDKDKLVVQERKCRHCFELRTQKMAEGTNFLQTEASLMTAATVAAGVAWLIISG